MKEIRVGLTGLSRAGKTVFLTSVIHELTTLTGEQLPEFRYNRCEFVGKAKPTPDGVLQFPYVDCLKAFRKEPPKWPDSTNDISEYRIHLTLRDAEQRTHQGVVVFVDYPGEFLVDVAQLDKTYDEWSDDCFRQFDTDTTCEQLVGPWKKFRSELDDLSVKNQEIGPDDKRVRRVQIAFGNFLYEARQARKPTSPLSPVLSAHSRPDKDRNDIIAPFFPLRNADRGNLGKLHDWLKQQFRAYCKEKVRPVLIQVANCTHQIVLVDLLDVLQSGPERFNEVQGQLKSVLHCYRRLQADASFPRQVWASLPMSSVPRVGRIRRVTFCATKADQVTKDCRSTLESLLQRMLDVPLKEIEFDAGKRGLADRVEILAISALRCTKDGERENHPTLKGRRKSDYEECEYDPGLLPTEWPQRASEWSVGERFLEFVPQPWPPIDSGIALPSIHLDRVLYSIVEGLLPPAPKTREWSKWFSRR